MVNSAMLEYMDMYCERLSPGLWGEPFNVVSNFAYLFAAILLLRMYRNAETTRSNSAWDIQGLILLLFLISIGSGLWHIYAKKWSLYADIIPILLFINLYILSCLVRVLRCSVTVTVVLFLAYHAFNFLLQNIFAKDFLNGSIFYLPTWLYLIGIGVIVLRRNKTLGQQYLWISGIFALALFFRTIDLGACSEVVIGTHFLWHIITAFMMYQLTAVLIKIRKADAMAS